MDKKTIEFLLKAGYTLPEIIMMDSVAAQDGAGQPTAAQDGTGQPTAAETLSAQLEALRKELSELREITHNANRRNAVIDNPTPAPTMEEQVEQLMKEVGT